MDIFSALTLLGIKPPSVAYIVGAVIFGLIGLAAYRYGKRVKRPHTKWIGVALMLYPYAVTSTGRMYAVGVTLCAGLFLHRS